MEKSNKRIGEILIEKGIISEAQVLDALREQKISGKFLGTILREKNLIDDEQLTCALAEQFKLKVTKLEVGQIDFELARKFSSSLLVDHRCFPLKEDEQTITVAIVNPLDAVALAQLEEQVKPKTLEVVLCSEPEMDQVLKVYKAQISQRIKELLKRKPIGQ